ncbi:MAG: hypothetical protein BWY76_00153 [bacterium ADurb.Bin429]|nr:MAG: hypothetical protein BWY76_00153 [bacterium ADurb.Bin429]
MLRYLVLSLFCVLGLAACAGQRQLQLTEWADRDWPRKLLNYDLTCHPGELFHRPMPAEFLRGVAERRQPRVHCALRSETISGARRCCGEEDA